MGRSADKISILTIILYLIVNTVTSLEYSEKFIVALNTLQWRYTLFKIKYAVKSPKIPNLNIKALRVPLTL